MANRLAGETSPYLLQHKDNPVDWWPWGDEAFAEARRTRRARAALGRVRGLSLVPRDGARVVRGARRPRRSSTSTSSRQGRPRGAAGRRRRLHGGGAGADRARRLADDGVHHARRASRSTAAPTSRRRRGTACRRSGSCWSRSRRPGRERREDVLAAGQRIVDGLAGARLRGGGDGPPTPDELDAAVRSLASSYDERRGGFGGAPKFPPSMVLEFLLRHHARTGDEDALAMAGGPARRWRAAGSTTSSAAGSRATPSTARGWCRTSRRCSTTTRCCCASTRTCGGPPDRRCARRVALETADFMLRELRTPEGGFASALDADTRRRRGLSRTSGRQRS